MCVFGSNNTPVVPLTSVVDEASNLVGQVPVVGEPIQEFVEGAVEQGGEWIADASQAVGEVPLVGPIAKPVIDSLNYQITGNTENIAPPQLPAVETPSPLTTGEGENVTEAGPVNIDSEEARLAALQARYLEDERARRFRGFGSTILTSGLGAQGSGNVMRPTLIGA